MSSSPFPSQEAEPPLWEGRPRSDAAGFARVVEWLGDVADRLGTSVTALVVGAVVVVVAAAVGVVALTAADSPAAELTIPYAAPATPEPDDHPSMAVAGIEDDPAELVVHAAGAVVHPGVYVVGVEARVGDLLAIAGGPTPDADLDRVNLAAPLADGSRVYVPAIDQEQPPPVVAGGGSPGGGSTGEVDPGALVDLNRASAAELERLPGVGPATAAAIIDHREQHGPFARVEDLLAVRGIGDAKLAALRDLVHV